MKNNKPKTGKIMKVKLTNIFWDNDDLIYGDRQDVIDDSWGELNEDNVEKYIQECIDEQPYEHEFEVEPNRISGMRIMCEWDWLSDYYSPCGLQAIVIESDIEIDGKEVSLDDLPFQSKYMLGKLKSDSTPPNQIIQK
jgi:hypothetical protein